MSEHPASARTNRSRTCVTSPPECAVAQLPCDHMKQRLRTESAPSPWPQLTFVVSAPGSTNSEWRDWSFGVEDGMQFEAKVAWVWSMSHRLPTGFAEARATASIDAPAGT
jgi:hypothetical protein